MANASVEIIQALRNTAKRINQTKGAYNWKHLGTCNCGNLVQEVTGQNAKQIHLEGIKKHGDWEMLVYLYNESSTYKIDQTIKYLVDLGFTLDDIVQLENLNNQSILNRIGINNKVLQRDNKYDVILYLETWANILEEELIEQIDVEQEMYADLI